MADLLKVIWEVTIGFAKIIFVLVLVAFYLGVLVWVVKFAYGKGYASMVYLFS